MDGRSDGSRASAEVLNAERASIEGDYNIRTPTYLVSAFRIQGSTSHGTGVPPTVGENGPAALLR